jgi:hypothetical protein
MATGYPPYHRVPHHLLGSQIARQVPRLEGGNYSDGLRDLVAICLEETPSLRPPIDTVQKHIYLTNTTKKYPTNSLKQLIRDYRIWEFSGGQRNSLFSAGGAQQLDLAPDQTGEDDSWDFGTRFSNVAGNPNEPNQERLSRSGTSHQPSRIPHSLQQIFYPDGAGGDFVAQWSNQKQHRISGQSQNRGRLSDLPLRNLSEPYPSAHQSVEIDLGTYDEETGLSHFADNTIKGNSQSSRWFMGDDDEESQNDEPLFENGTRRATKDWTFPSMMMTPTEESPSLAPAAELRSISSSEASSAPSSPPRIISDRDDPPRPSTASTDAHPGSHFSLASIRGGSVDAGNRGSFHKAWRSVPPSIDAGLMAEASAVDMEGPTQLQRHRQASLSRQAESATSAFGRRFSENEQRSYPPPSTRGAAPAPVSFSAAPGLTANAPEMFGFANGPHPLAPLRTQLPRPMFNGDRKEVPISSASDVDEYEDSDDEPLFNVPVPAPPSQEALTEGASNEILIAEMERLLGSFNVSLEIVRTSFEAVDRRTRRAASREVNKSENQVGQ